VVLITYNINVADPGSPRCFLTPESAIPDGKNRDQGSGINISDHISERLISIFVLKILEFFVADSDPESRDPVPF
jgi:hypothetical protein